MTALHRARAARFDWGQPFVYFVALLAAAVTIVPVSVRHHRRLPHHRADQRRPGRAGPTRGLSTKYTDVLGSATFWTQVLNSTIVAVGDHRSARWSSASWRRS